MSNKLVHCDRRDRQLTIACHKFNTAPQSGIEYLRENCLISGDSPAAAVAQFLHTAAGLSKKAIGEFFGRPDAFNQEVLEAFVRRHDFSDQPLLPSMRRLLAAFLLPSETQQIDRISSCFAHQYFLQNSGAFASADACAVLCNALLMLNTELHHPALQGRRPGAERLVEMAQHAGQPVLSRARLQQLFDSLLQHPFEVPTDSGADDLVVALRRPERSGWLTERRWLTGRCCRLGRWHRRWFVLTRGHLFYFASREDHVRGERPLGMLPLVNLLMQVVQDHCKKFCFELRGAAGPMHASETGCCWGGGEGPLKLDACRLSAESSQDMVEWMLAVKTEVTEQPAPMPTPRPCRPARVRTLDDGREKADSDSWEFVMPQHV